MFARKKAFVRIEHGLGTWHLSQGLNDLVDYMRGFDSNLLRFTETLEQNTHRKRKDLLVALN